MRPDPEEGAFGFELQEWQRLVAHASISQRPSHAATQSGLSQVDAGQGFFLLGSP